MIKSIELHNFQSHRKTVLEMDKLTVLTGGSNSGKSAVLRAVGGMLRNDSVGDYVTHGEKTLKVILNLESGDSVEWIKGAGANQYRIVYADGREEDYQKVGSDIPEEVASIIGIAPISMESGQKLHINLHEQLESPFLVGREYTAGYAAKVFGEITSAAKIQAAIGEASKEAKRASARLKIKKEDSSELESKLMEFLDLDAQNLTLKEAEKSLLEAKSLRDRSKKIEELHTKIVDIDMKLLEPDLLIPRYEPVEGLDLESVQTDVYSLLRLEKIVSQLDGIDSYIVKLDKSIKELEDIEKDSGLETATTQANELSELKALLNRIEDFDSKILKAEELIEKAEGILKDIDDQISEAADELDHCPTCGQDMTAEAKRHLEDHDSNLIRG